MEMNSPKIPNYHSTWSRTSYFQTENPPNFTIKKADFNSELTDTMKVYIAFSGLHNNYYVTTIL